VGEEIETAIDAAWDDESFRSVTDVESTQVVALG